MGAQRVMHLMPATAKSLGIDNPFDTRSNIMGSAKYIVEKLSQYNEDIKLALAAYNVGSGNVAKYGGVPPFSETTCQRGLKHFLIKDIIYIIKLEVSTDSPRLPFYQRKRGDMYE